MYSSVSRYTELSVYDLRLAILLHTTASSEATRSSFRLQSRSKCCYFLLRNIFKGSPFGNLLVRDTPLIVWAVLRNYYAKDSLIEIGDAFRELLFAAARFQGSLYNKKHAFYFRNIKQWVNCLKVRPNSSMNILCDLSNLLFKTGVLRILGMLMS